MRTLAAKQASVKPGTVIIGADLADRENVAQVINTQAEKLEGFTFTHDAAGYAKLMRYITRLQAQHEAPEVIVAMEPTNYYWKLVATALEAHDLRYVLVNAYTVKKHREGDQLDRSKDDSRDGYFIGEITRTGKFTETQLLHGERAELRELCQLYGRLRSDQQRIRNRIIAGIGQLFPEVRTVFKNVTGQTARALLRQHAIPAQICALSWEELVAAVRIDFKGRRLQVSKIRQAQALAAESVGLTEGATAIQLGLQCHLDQWETLEAQRQAVCAAITAVFLGLPEAPWLLSVPRLGVIAAATILAEIGEPQRFRRSAQLVKLAGIQPTPHTSGRHSRSRTPMSHQGRPGLRTALYYAVLRLIQGCPAFRAAYHRFQSRKTHPLTPMEALGAMMNKLLRILWAVMQSHQVYDPTRVGQTPA